MPCSWQKEDYFSLLMASDKRSYTALEMLVDDLHADKEKTVNKFLCHSGSEDFLWGLVRLLGNDTARYKVLHISLIYKSTPLAWTYKPWIGNSLIKL